MDNSLLALKTELFRKKAEAEKSRNQSAPLLNPGASKNESKTAIDSSIKLKDAPTAEEEDEWKKSKAMLEAKSKFYDRMATGKGIGSDGSKRYLIDFEQKVMSDPKVIEEAKEKYGDEVFDESEQVFRPVHYQHLRENEARELGVGYFDFSLDEETRNEQIDMLKKLHDDSKKKQVEQNSEKAKRQQALQERLNKIRAKHNLPPEELPKEEPIEKAGSLEEQDKMNLLEQNRVRAANREASIASQRKRDSMKTLGEIYDEKIKKARDEREPEFAPPSFYQEAEAKQSKETISLVPGTGSFVSSLKNPMKFLEDSYENRNDKGLSLPTRANIGGLIIGDSVHKRVKQEEISEYVFIRAYGGAKVKDLLTRAENSLKQPISHVVISVGLNDALACNENDFEFKTNYRRLINTVAAKFSPKIIDCCTITPAKFTHSHINSFVLRLNVAIWQVLEKSDELKTNCPVQLLDVYSAFNQSIAPVSVDGLHPTLEGVQVLVACYRSRFESSGIEVDNTSEVTIRTFP